MMSSIRCMRRPYGSVLVGLSYSRRTQASPFINHDMHGAAAEVEKPVYVGAPGGIGDQDKPDEYRRGSAAGGLTTSTTLSKIFILFSLKCP